MSNLLLGNSVQIKELNETIKQVAPSNISVLITGESGTGKEIVANAIHYYSKRRHKPLIKVNCGAIPEGIIESELFGHQKGAFTGAIETRKGYFELADGGTIFLDEIGEMPLSTQVKILRVLESGEFMRVGGYENIKVDVRVLAATNRDLNKEVLNGNFREDLFYRLKSVNLHIPPLRERKQDIKVLFDFFVDSFCRENKIEFGGIEEDAMEYLINYVWYGNARELKNFVESIIVLRPNKKLTLEDVKKHLKQEPIENRRLPAIKIQQIDSFGDKDLILRALIELKTDIMEIKNILNELKFNNTSQVYDINNDFFIPKDKMNQMTMEDIEKAVLYYLLKNNNFNVTKVSKILNQTPRNIYRKMKNYDIKKE
ncbi:MAG: sigma-54 dependent transcriptional regulator [Ignavibacteria bacterium]|nr:sigma-54 dependent transcriptional regulator [Ignavibacteria bacterium]